MELKKNLAISTQDFFYDLFDGGYLKPEQICEKEEDIKKINEAVKILEDFKSSCEKQIENFID